jgi:hypothetical protein
MANDKTVYLKQQHVTRGTAGYKNIGPNVEVVDENGKTVAKGSKKAQ